MEAIDEHVKYETTQRFSHCRHGIAGSESLNLKSGSFRTKGGRIFLNPPFEPGVEACFLKMYQERLAGRTTKAIVLWMSDTETAAWKTLTASRAGCVSFCKDPFYGARVFERVPVLADAVLCLGEA